MSYGKDALYKVRRLGEFGVQLEVMGIDDIYSKAKRAKPGFDDAIKKLAKRHHAEPIITSLKTKERAQEKATAQYNGDINQVDDILRASVIVTGSDKVSAVFNSILSEFDVIRASNKYTEKQHSSDGFFDARVYVNLDGLPAEIQIHTIAMQSAKESVHDLYEERQRIIRSGKPINQEQRKRIAEINKKMRDIFRKANQ